MGDYQGKEISPSYVGCLGLLYISITKIFLFANISNVFQWANQIWPNEGKILRVIQNCLQRIFKWSTSNEAMPFAEM